MLEAARTITLIVIFAILDKVGEILRDSSKLFFLNIHLYNYITLNSMQNISSFCKHATWFITLHTANSFMHANQIHFLLIILLF